MFIDDIKLELNRPKKVNNIITIKKSSNKKQTEKEFDLEIKGK